MGYIHGSNMIVFLGGKAIGHCSSCEVQDSAETKSRAIKVLPEYSSGEQQDTDLTPVAGEKPGLWDEKSVSKRSVTINADAFVCDPESGMGYDELVEAMDAAEPVKVKYAHADEVNSKYRVGLFVITSLNRNDPADDDSTLSLTVENSGPVRTKTV